MLAYASDMTLLDTSLLPHGFTLFTNTLQLASLDHAMWFHRPFRADEWLLYVQDSPSASDARGFNRGSVFSRDGTAGRIRGAGRPYAPARRAENVIFAHPLLAGAFSRPATSFSRATASKSAPATSSPTDLR